MVVEGHVVYTHIVIAVYNRGGIGQVEERCTLFTWKVEGQVYLLPQMPCIAAYDRDP